MIDILDLVDSYEYTATNCYTHQLLKCLNAHPNVKTVALADVRNTPRPKLIVSRLKQRTLFRVASDLKNWAGNCPIVVFDQDPWEAYKDDSPYKGAYEHIASQLNVRTFAVTTKWWSDFVNNRGLPCKFVKMGMLSSYCSSSPKYESRQIEVGFMGTVHAHRKKLFDQLATMGINVQVVPGGKGYNEYLRFLSDTKIFIHSEDCEIMLDGNPSNLNVGLWIKDVEAAARGCFSIRNDGSGSSTYLEGVETVKLYDTVDQVPGIIADIQKMDIVLRQDSIDRTVELISRSNEWAKTALALIEQSDT